MSLYSTDPNGATILYSGDKQQVMMEWEKPYMEKSIDFLEPTGDVLEIGFGLGYSATQIMKHEPKSYTVIECDKNVIEKIKEWAKKMDKEYPTISITIVEGTWQDMLQTVGIFDSIYFDDYPLGNWKEDDAASRTCSFIHSCIQHHTRVGSKISSYLNHNSEIDLFHYTIPFVNIKYKSIDIQIPHTCQYRNIKEQKCLIPLITKIAEYDDQIAQEYPITEINKVLNNLYIHSKECSRATKLLIIPSSVIIVLTGKALKIGQFTLNETILILKAMKIIENYFIHQ